jgi:hypothetical protein
VVPRSRQSRSPRIGERVPRIRQLRASRRTSCLQDRASDRARAEVRADGVLAPELDALGLSARYFRARIAGAEVRDGGRETGS